MKEGALGDLAAVVVPVEHKKKKGVQIQLDTSLNGGTSSDSCGEERDSGSSGDSMLLSVDGIKTIGYKDEIKKQLDQSATSDSID